MERGKSDGFQASAMGLGKRNELHNVKDTGLAEQLRSAGTVSAKQQCSIFGPVTSYPFPY